MMRNKKLQRVLLVLLGAIYTAIGLFMLGLVCSTGFVVCFIFLSIWLWR